MRTFGFLVLLVLLALIVLVLVLGRARSSPPSHETYPDTEEYPRSGIARCRYRGYTPILTCSYQAFS